MKRIVKNFNCESKKSNLFEWIGVIILIISGIITYLIGSNNNSIFFMFFPPFFLLVIVVLPCYCLYKKRDINGFLFYLPVLTLYISMIIYFVIGFYYSTQYGPNMDYIDYFLYKFIDFQEKYMYGFIFVIYGGLLGGIISRGNNKKGSENISLKHILLLGFMLLLIPFLFSEFIKNEIPKNKIKCFIEKINHISSLKEELNSCLSNK